MNAAAWLRRDLELLEAHYGVALDRGVGRSLVVLAERLEGIERTVTFGPPPPPAERRADSLGRK